MLYLCSCKNLLRLRLRLHLRNLRKNDSEASLDSVAGALILLDFSHTVFVFYIIFKIKKHGRHKRKSATTLKKTY